MSASDILVLLLQTGFVLLAALVLGAFAGRAPALRTALYRLAILTVLVLAVASPWLRERPSPVVPVSWSPTVSAPIMVEKPRVAAAPSVSEGDVEPAAVEYEPLDPFAYARTVWLLGVLLLGAHLVLGYVALARIRRGCRPVEGDEVLAGLARQTGVRTPLLVEGSAVGNPFVAGVRRPTIFLPENWHKQVEPDVVEAVLRHELAHIANGDLRWSLLHRLACIVLWPQVLLWLLRKPMNAASEELCDRHVLGSGMPGPRYAECLLNLRDSLRARPCPSLGIGAVSSKSFLGKRIEAILDGRSRAIVLSRRVSVSLRVAAVLMATAAALIFARPLDSASGFQDPFAPAIKGPYDAKVRVLSPNGQPVSGARAWLVFSGDVLVPSSKALQVAGPDVVVSKEGVPPKAFTILAVLAPGYGISFVPMWPTDERVQSIRLEPEVSARGQLVTPDGKPATGMKVKATMLYHEMPRRQLTFLILSAIPDMNISAVTDEEGSFAIHQLPPGVTARFDLEDDRYAVLPYTARVKTRLRGGVLAKPIRLEQAAVINGRVTRNGKPVAGLQVGSQPNHDLDRQNMAGGGMAVTDTNGRYSIKRQPPGVYNIIADLRGKLGEEVTATAREAVRVGRAETVEGQDFELIPGVLIEGSVADNAGKPVADVYVGVYGPSHPRSSAWVQSEKTDAQGRYRLRVPPGKQYVYIADGRYKAEPQDIEVAAGTIGRADFHVTAAPAETFEAGDPVDEESVPVEEQDLGPVLPVASFGPGRPFYGPVRLRNGAIVRLAFVQNDAEKPHTLWNPDGTPASAADVERSIDMSGFNQGEATRSSRAYFMRVDIGGVPRGSYSCEVDLPFQSVHKVWQTYGDQQGRSMDLMCVRAPKGMRMTDVRFGIAAGPKTVFQKGRIGQAPLYARVFDQSSSDHMPGDLNITVLIPKSVEGKEVLLAAYDSNGRAFELSSWEPESSKDKVTGLPSRNFGFRRNGAGAVARVELFVRDFEWATFKGVHLSPR